MDGLGMNSKDWQQLLLVLLHAPLMLAGIMFYQVCVYFNSSTAVLPHLQIFILFCETHPNLRLRLCRLTDACTTQASTRCQHKGAGTNEREGGLARCYGANAEGALYTTTNTPAPVQQHPPAAPFPPIRYRTP
ncbi:hypothetical protein BDU57DRAFT_33883 [Ampelomyces quisqualis]|uniref:Uncharacterized protein n=1 Tax=Ampelomyces quisqualis TaxID=50730 RepID=A0A6A5R266_AMPQU|nr:hypothetical protein BDU57DRAFT_33883 [Ampelomyces quisqualis]